MIPFFFGNGSSATYEILSHWEPWTNAVGRSLNRPKLECGWHEVTNILSNGEQFSTGRPRLQLHWPWYSSSHAVSARDRMIWERVVSKVYFSAMTFFEEQLSNATPRRFADQVKQLCKSQIDIESPDVRVPSERAATDGMITLELGTRIGRRPGIYLTRELKGTRFLASTGETVDANDILATIRIWSRQPPFSLDETGPLKANEQRWGAYVLSVAMAASTAYRLEGVLEPSVRTLPLGMSADDEQVWDGLDQDETVYPIAPLSV